jgi:hypothetical protein
MLTKNPGFPAVAVLTLALGIGANTAIFAVLNSVVLRPQALPQPGRVVRLWEAVEHADWTGSISYPRRQRFHTRIQPSRSFHEPTKT